MKINENNISEVFNIFTVRKAKNILDLIYEKENITKPKPKIKLSISNKFFCRFDNDPNNTIYIGIKLPKRTKSILDNNVPVTCGKNLYTNIYGAFYEIFAFLHELGHHIQLDWVNNQELYLNVYSEWREVVYDSESERQLSYRNIYYEKEADGFALNMINKYHDIIKK